LDILFFVFLYILLGQSFNVLAGYTGLISLGQASFFGIGALVTRFLWVVGVPFYLSIIAGGVAASLVSIIIGFPCLRLRGAYFSIGTLALTIIGFILTSNVFITESFLPPKYMTDYSTLIRYYVGLVLAIGATVMVYIIANSRLGMGMIAVREDEEAAKSIGVNAFRSKLRALLISAFGTGLGGGAFAFYQVALYLYHGFSPLWSFEPILVTFIGGPGTLFGPVFGAVFYIVLREIFALTIGAPHIVIFGIIFILIVLLLPRGLAEVWEKFYASININTDQTR
jgi:branched-chain amino acid transport system permease protein